MSMRIILTFSSLLTTIMLLTACGVAGRAANPPLPTIVPAQEEAPATEASEPPTNTPSPLPPTQPPTEPAVEATATETDAPTEAVETATASPTPEPTPTEPPPSLPPLESLAIALSPVADGFTKPLYLGHAGDGSGRLFVIEQAGRILIVQNGAVNPTPFLDIVSIVGSDANEQGLLSVAFHPNYAENGRFFVYYTDKQGDAVIARYQVSADPNQAAPTSAKILLTVGEPYSNHNGGQLAFDAEGYLYIGLGDGGAAGDPQNNAQDLGALLGKILRIDVDQGEPYGVPQSNPFVTTEGARPEIWSYGWRNPWRFTFDPATDDLYVADVGQNQYEEVDVELTGSPGGLNYGWRLMEGFHCFDPAECDPATLDVVLPVTEYDHTQGCSITGGYVYRGDQSPDLNGIYFYGDYCTGLIWGLRREADGSWSQALLLQTDHNLSSFGQDEAGEVYIVDHQGSVLQVTN